VTSTVYGIGITAFLALVGKSRPGTYLKTVAYLSAAHVSISAIDSYSTREISRGIFKLDNVDPKPGKLWERTKHWTVDDTVIGGGILGTFLALNPRALPGVGGWKRFFGAATVGCGVGGFLGQSRLSPAPSGMTRLIDAGDAQIKQTQYKRLKENEKAQEKLSRFGKVAFAWYTWPIWDLSINPFKAVTEAGSNNAGGAITGGFQPGQMARDPHAGISKEEIEKHTLIQIEFNNGELRGPDIEHGYRAYKDSLTDRDPIALRDWLEHLEGIRNKTVTETQYVWHHLAAKEQEFYSLEGDDKEKDIIRRELQLLNNLAGDFTARGAILAYHIADALKRLKQTGQDETTGQNLLAEKKSSMPTGLPADWRSRYSPNMIAEQVRLNWTRQKELLGFLEQSNTMIKELGPEPGSPQEKQFKQIQENTENMKKNVEATERLLKDFEEQIRRAENYVEEPKSTEP
jgi:hypothetical protein